MGSYVVERVEPSVERLVECLPSWQVVVWFPTRRCPLESDGSYESDRASVVPQTGYDRLSSRRHDGLAVESENAHRSRDRLTGAGARLRANGLRCLCVEPRLRISSSMAIGLHTGSVRRSGACTTPARSTQRGGAACRPESLPGWRVKGAVAVRSRWCGGGSVSQVELAVITSQARRGLEDHPG
jgi:hypothetical protein